MVVLFLVIKSTIISNKNSYRDTNILIIKQAFGIHLQKIYKDIFESDSKTYDQLILLNDKVGV